MQINLVTTNPELLNDRVTGIQTALQADEATLAGQQAAFSSASQSTFRNIDSEVLLNFSGSTAITGSVAAIRGNTAIASGTTISSGFVYGTQGKLTIQGALTTANYLAGVIGQVDTSAAGSLGTTPLCAIWGDMGATSTAVTATGADILKLTNTTNTIINSAIMVNANASYLMDITDAAYGGVHFVVGTTASTAAGCLKVKVDGVVRYLQLYSAES